MSTPDIITLIDKVTESIVGLAILLSVLWFIFIIKNRK